MLRLAPLICSVALAAASSAGGGQSTPAAPATPMNAIAERYVKLVLAMGRHDADYVDAYYGPPEWKSDAAASKSTIDQIRTQAGALLDELKAVRPGAAELDQLRHQYLERQLSALVARVRMLSGERLSFDEESRALYDAVAPRHPDSHFQAILDQLEKRFPGTGPLVTRYDEFRRAFVISPDKLDAVFKTAVQACRERTARHIALPPGESFVIEYVTNKSWSGYNWYQGGYRSLIQVNTDLPIFIDRAIDLACHEGYPGHHVYNALLEKHLVKDRGWPEFSVYALFSPQSLIAEGTANFGIEVAFPGKERVAYEKSALFPAAGLDAAKADEYYEVQALVEQLSYAGNEAARRYLNGDIDREAAVAWLERYALMPRDRAAQRVRFMDQYRSYVINYNLGQDMVRRYIDAKGGTADRPDVRWRVFEELLSSPRLPSTLR
ncbi:MAG TPA: hypothetical protein VE379_11300 [Vicinamibacterales bacterium]|jgi:hypothetical protein|nr:hypothetical protein [Vicinamibacterales bacterium]